MRLPLILLVGVAATLAACSSETDHSAHNAEAKAEAHEGHHVMEVSEREAKDKKEAAGKLVERFGIDACAKADLIGTVRRTSPEEGESELLAFQAPVACAEETLAAVKKLGFSEDETDTYVGTSDDGNVEKVKIMLDDAASDAGIEWEVIRK